MQADYTPNLGDYKTLKPFRYWCQKVLPLVYDDSLSYYELLCKVVDYLNKTMEDTETLNSDVNNLHNAYVQLQSYVNQYFESLDVQAEINTKLDKMVSDGTLSSLILPIISDKTNPSFVGNIASMTDRTVNYVLTTNGHVYYYNNGWIDSGIIYGNASTGQNVYTGLIQANNYESLLPDLNNVTSNTTYMLNFAKNSTAIPVNTPFGNTWEVPVIVKFTSYVNKEGARRIGDYQTFEFNGIEYVRYYTNTWTMWRTTGDNDMSVYPTLIAPNNYTTLLPDLDNVTESVTYMLNFARGTSDIPKNTPFNEMWSIAVVALFSSYVIEPTVRRIGDYQTFEFNGITFARYYSTKWSDWRTVTTQEFEVGTGKAYTSLSKCILDATMYPNSVVRVNSGTYDIIKEFKELYGNDFFDNYTASSIKGIMLKNNVHVIFSSTAKVVCNYTGSNTNVQKNFSPFNASVGGFTLENCNLESSNVRYAIHDERGVNTDMYVNKYIGCTIKHNKGTGTGYVQCIGGGLGTNGYVVIDSCSFESVGTSDNIGVVSYHNSQAGNAKSNIVIKDCYFKTGTVRVSWYGSSTQISRVIVTNCLMKSEPFTVAENSSATVVNVEMVKWNNVIN